MGHVKKHPSALKHLWQILRFQSCVAWKFEKISHTFCAHVHIQCSETRHPGYMSKIVETQITKVWLYMDEKNIKIRVYIYIHSFQVPLNSLNVQNLYYLYFWLAFLGQNGQGQPGYDTNQKVSKRIAHTWAQARGSGVTIWIAPSLLQAFVRVPG